MQTQPAAADKLFVSSASLTRDAFRLARQIYDSGFRPEVLIVLWRGGTPVGIVVHEFLLFKGVRTYHVAVKAESYTAMAVRGEPRVEHFDSVLRLIAPGQRVLLVDDIFDTGHTLCKVRELLLARTPHIRIAALYFKPGNNRTELVPDYYVRRTERWVVFPHELVDLTDEEIRAKDPFVHRLLHAPPTAEAESDPPPARCEP